MLTARRLAALAAVLLLGRLALPATAQASTPADVGCKRDRLTGQEICVGTLPGSPGSPGTTPAPSPPGRGDGQTVSAPQRCTFGSVAVPCSTAAGEWRSDLYCYVKLITPQPPPDAPIWGGHWPAGGTPDGAVYLCTADPAGRDQAVTEVWLPGPPPGPTLSPRDAARALTVELNLRAAAIGSAPYAVEQNPRSEGLVGLPVWLWVADPGARTTGPATLSGTRGGRSVTLTARLDHISWDMGDGSAVTCTGPGTPFDRSYGITMSPTCGYRYQDTSWQQPGGVFTVTATSSWAVSWVCDGKTGVIPVTVSSKASLRVGEAQALVTG